MLHRLSRSVLVRSEPGGRAKLAHTCEPEHFAQLGQLAAPLADRGL